MARFFMNDLVREWLDKANGDFRTAEREVSVTQDSMKQFSNAQEDEYFPPFLLKRGWGIS